MEITITVSEKIAELIQHKAEENGKNVSEFAANLLEEKVKEDFPDSIDIRKLRKSVRTVYRNVFKQ